MKFLVAFGVLPDVCNRFVNAFVKLHAKPFLAAFVECRHLIYFTQGKRRKSDRLHFGTRVWSCRIRLSFKSAVHSSDSLPSRSIVFRRSSNVAHVSSSTGGFVSGRAGVVLMPSYYAHRHRRATLPTAECRLSLYG